MDYYRAGFAQTPIRSMGSLGTPDGLGAYFQTTYQQPISPAQPGASTVAYTAIEAPTSGLGCGPCAAAAATSGLGDAAGARIIVAGFSRDQLIVFGGVVLAGVAYGLVTRSKKLKANRRRARRARR